MRDLKADLEICNKATPGPWYQEANYWDEKNMVLGRGVFQYDSYAKLLADMIDKEEDAEFIADARKGWPHAIERAIKAETEVEMLKINMVDYRRGTVFMTKQIQGLRAENAQLRKVADAARALAPSEMYQYTRHLFNLKHTLDEYDKAKEGQVEMGEYGGTCAYQIPPSKIDISMGDKNDL